VFNATIPITQRDTGYNGQAIVKVQYQKNFGSQAYFRVYGYTYYSNYIGTGPISSWQPITGYDSGDYELSSHTRGISASFNDQINAQNLLELQASYVTATSLRMNNTQMFNNADSFAVLVNPHDLTSGTCYTAPTTATGAAAPTSCNPGNWGTSPATSATFLSLAANYTCNTTPGCNPATVNPNAASYTCGGVTCAFYTVENGAWAEYNAVKPVFTGYSITDQFKPNDKLNVDVGLRLDSYQFTGGQHQLRSRSKLLVRGFQRRHVLQHPDATTPRQDATRPHRAGRKPAVLQRGRSVGGHQHAKRLGPAVHL